MLLLWMLRTFRTDPNITTTAYNVTVCRLPYLLQYNSTTFCSTDTTYDNMFNDEDYDDEVSKYGYHMTVKYSTNY